MFINIESITKKIFESECDEVYFFTSKSKVGILNNHKNENFILKSGKITIINKNEKTEFNVLSGLADVKDNHISLCVLLK